jgi:hypothetical protein
LLPTSYTWGDIVLMGTMEVGNNEAKPA